jgi:hypothetical protein
MFNNQELSVYASDVVEGMRKAAYERKFMWMGGGGMGIAPAAAKVGDSIVSYLGAGYFMF